jgi:hypothetical protein
MSDLTPSYEPEAGQVFLEGLPAGAGGEARLVPVTGLDLAFDRADGHLSRAIVDADGADGPGELVAAMLVRLFGREAPGVVRDAAVRPGESRVLSPEPGLCAALSSLARLDAAQATSPVPRSSPWWAAEAAELAERAGLKARARAEARRAVRDLTKARGHQTFPAQASRTALAVAGIAATDEPEAASQLRESIGRAPAEPVRQWLAAKPLQPDAAGLDVAAEVERLEKDQVKLPGLQWVLDPGLVPEGLFQPGLSPHSDLVIRHEGGADRIVVEALLAPGAECAALGRCQARLVDPAVRRVLAHASFTESGSRVKAELQLPFPLDELLQTWIEVVEGEDRPVRSAKGHRIRRALRWADAALRAERGPAGLAPRSAGGDWAALAAVAWEQCRRDWESAGDTDRAFLAARRLAALDPRTRPPKAPSTTAARLASRAPLPGPNYLAELLGE